MSESHAELRRIAERLRLRPADARWLDRKLNALLTEQDALREAVNLALMHLEDPRAIAAVRAALPTPKQQEDT